MVVLMAYIFC